MIVKRIRIMTETKRGCEEGWEQGKAENGVLKWNR